MFAPWLRIIAPVAAGRIVILGAAGAATTGVVLRGAPADCPNAARFTSSASIPVRNMNACFEIINNQNWLGLIGPSQYRSLGCQSELGTDCTKADGVRDRTRRLRGRYREVESVRDCRSEYARCG